MATTEEFAQFILDQTSSAGEVSIKKMFGEYGLYCNGKIVGLICDNQLFIKPTPEGKEILGDPTMKPPYPSAKDYFWIDNPDDHTLLCQLIKESARVLPAPKPKKKKA